MKQVFKFLAVCLFIFNTNIFAQTNNFPVLDSFNLSVSSFVGLRANDKKELGVIQQQKLGDQYLLQFHRFNPHSRKSYFFEDSLLTDRSNISDFYINDSLVFVISSGLHVFYPSGDPVFIKKINEQYINMKFIEQMTDTTYLLWRIYNYHPADDKSGLFMYIYNSVQRKIVDSAFYPYSGSMFGFLTVQWLTIYNNNILAFSGLSNQVISFDYNLKPKDTFEIHLFSGETLQRNKRKLYITDSTLERLDREFKNGNTSLVSDFYNKSSAWNIINDFRANNCFLEKVLKLNDTTILLSVSKPGYEFSKRDIYTYNVNKNELTPLGTKMMVPPDTLYTYNELANLNYTIDRPFQPVFVDGVPYTITGSTKNDFQPGPLSQLKEREYYNLAKKKSKTWYLIKHPKF